MSNPPQPPLPPEEEWSDAERNFLDESPPGFFPENQDSNLGLIRKLFSDRTQEAADQLTLIFSEKFVQSAVAFLDEWERQMGLSIAPSGLATLDRRTRLLGRVRKGPFTRTRRRQIVEEFIKATFGEVLTFGPEGLTIGAGLTLHSPPGDVSSLYTIVENITGFSYTVTIDTSITVDAAGLQRELERITPAHISFTLTTGAVSTATSKAGTDVGSGAEASKRDAKETASDIGTGADTSGGTFKQGTIEIGIALEGGALTAAIPGSEAGTSIESSGLLAKPPGTESGSGSDIGFGGAVQNQFGEDLFGAGTMGGLTGVTDVVKRGETINSDAGSASASIVVTKPVSITGDLIYAAIAIADQTAGVNVSPPDGTWTLVGSRISTQDGGQSLFIFEKTAGASEPSSYVFTIGGGTPANFQWANYAATYYDQGIGQTLHVRNLNLADSPRTGGNLVTPSVTPGIDNAIVVSSFAIDDPVAVLGKTSIGAVNDVNSVFSNVKAGTKYTVAGTRPLTKLRAYMNKVVPGGAGEVQPWKAVVYTSAGVLVEASTEIILTPADLTGWKEFIFAGTNNLTTANDYYLMLHAGAPPATMQWAWSWDDPGDSNYFANFDPYFDGPANPMGTDQSAASRSPSIYLPSTIALAPVSPGSLIEAAENIETSTTLILGNYEQKQTTAAAAAHTISSSGTTGGVSAIGVIAP
jgi:hypothetical protein